MMRRKDYQTVVRILDLAIEEADHGKDNRPTLKMALAELERQQITREQQIMRESHG